MGKGGWGGRERRSLRSPSGRLTAQRCTRSYRSRLPIVCDRNVTEFDLPDQWGG